ncbi:AMP-binding protein [Gordonia sp. X0973]|uniref:fatty-acid--CoA ligase FadD1 n=1 Tax=Gordonia sp. X0973 TaxID=2742602 RepID=UPI000F5443D2|nr:fatty-acid--CoA ligase FadD1 [Gordonia sp. X0973]QKT06934.1 AMP-binding protein [Gordonia sp. X0973]
MADTIQQTLRDQRDNPGTAIAYGDERISWKQYLDDAERQASTLIGLLDPDRPPHVGTLLGNTPAMLTALAAAGLGGYVLCGINNTRRGEGLARDVAKADVQILLVDEENRALLDDVELPGVRVVAVESDEWRGQCAQADPLTPLCETGAMDPFMMIFTSGTSGDPKAVLVSNFMVTVAGQFLVEKFGLTRDDVCYMAMPLFHSNAIASGYALAITAGATMAPAKFSASGFLSDIRRYGATYMNYVGKPLAYILATPERPDDADNPLRIAFGNEAADRDIAEFGRRFGVMVLDAFGSTENAVIIGREADTPAGSVGRGLPGVAIYDPETVTECAVAEFDDTGALVNADAAVGELVNTEGASYFSGYYNDEKANAERMRGGMYWSGDLAYRDADGWIYLAGRTSDWMRVDGENLAAAPVERVLMRLPAISRIAVYALPDPNGGDRVATAMVLRDGATLSAAEFADFLAAQPDLSPKAWPTVVRIAADLPSTATNKILKRELVTLGTDAGADQIWTREPRTKVYSE